MKIYSLFISAIASLVLSSTLLAQQTQGWAHDIRVEERNYVERVGFERQLSRGITTPPEYSYLRTSAEWEEIEVLTIAWEGFSCILKQIVAASVSECRVVVFTENPSSTSNYLLSGTCGGAISLDNVDIVEADLNSIWIRDYGANTVYGSLNDDRILVDWMYNRPRPDDDVIPDVLAAHMGIEIYSTTAAPTDLMNTGGNFMTDGFGTAFESELIIDENQGGTTWWTSFPDHSVEEIESILHDFMGINTLITMPTLPYDGIHHIDMHMKLLDESTLLISEYPDGVADGPQINANMDYVLSNYTTRWGTPFEVIRIPSPPEENYGYPDQGGWYETYSNAVFVNNKILLPTYYEQYDTTAIRIWEDAMPGYEIVGIDCDGSDPIISLSGAIHCITHSVGVEDPLIISHLPLPDTENTTEPYYVGALISHRTSIEQATLYYALNPEGPWTTVGMQTEGFSQNMAADIPAQPEGTDVYYYIEAQAFSGKVGTRPMPAPEGWWEFHVGGINIDGLSELELGGFAPIYPNPASAITCVPVLMNEASGVKVQLWNILGQPLKNIFEGNLPQGETKLFFDASTLSSGAYVITLDLDNGQTHSQTVMVKN
jgi:agmatine deiminase